MPRVSACCCWESLYEGSRASAVFSLVTGIINCIIDIWLLVHLHYLYDLFEANEEYALLVPGILFFIYLELACNLALIGLSFCLWIGINRGYDGRRWIQSWMMGVTAFRIYDFLLGVYILGWLGAHRIEDVVYIQPVSIVIAFYWILNTILLICAILCVWSYWQDLMDDVYGRARRIKYFVMLSNIRQAAKSSRSNPGTMTPRSFMSQRSLAMSQSSIPASQHHMGPPIGASSHASLPISHKSGPPPQQYHGHPQQQYHGPPQQMYQGQQPYHGQQQPYHGQQQPYHGPPQQQQQQQPFQRHQQYRPPPQQYQQGPPPHSAGYRGGPPQRFQ